MFLLHKKFFYLVAGSIVFLLNAATLASPDKPLICSVSDSQDDFKVYPNQLTYSSDTFLHYQLIDGLTVLVVNRHTMQFNRLSSLNLLSHSTLDPSKSPEDYQFFSGVCEVVEAS